MSEYFFKTSNGEEIPIIITTKRGVKNIILRPKSKTKNEIHITKPWLCSSSNALKFIEQKRRWLESFFNKTESRQKLKIGDVAVLFGQKVLILQDEKKFANSFVRQNDGTYILVLGGKTDMFQHRLVNFIKKEAEFRIKEIIKTVSPEFRPRRISLKDTMTRWGSCSSSGCVSFSWRLAFAPPEVLRYVVMHELAHIKHMNHSPDFWKQVADLYGEGVGRAKLWLAKNGQSLHGFI